VRGSPLIADPDVLFEFCTEHFPAQFDLVSAAAWPIPSE